jgi:hypothetical protein
MKDLKRIETENKVRRYVPDFFQKTELERLELVYLYTCAFGEENYQGLRKHFQALKAKLTQIPSLV